MSIVKGSLCAILTCLRWKGRSRRNDLPENWTWPGRRLQLGFQDGNDVSVSHVQKCSLFEISCSNCGRLEFRSSAPLSACSNCKKNTKEGLDRSSFCDDKSMMKHSSFVI